MSLVDYLATRTDRCVQGYAMEHHPHLCACKAFAEYSVFLRVLADAVRDDGTLHVNDTRTPLRESPLVQAKHIGPMWQRARAEKLIRQIGLEDSDDAEGHNTHQKSRVFKWLVLGGSATNAA